jgi:hypothetical protein
MLENLPKTPPPAIPIQQVTTVDTQPLFDYQPGSINELADELRQPKQPFDLPDFESLAGTPEALQSNEPSPAEARTQNKLAARTLIGIGDGVLAFLLSIYGHKEPYHYRLPGESHKDIIPALERCMAGKNMDITPGWALFLAIIVAYLPIVMMAHADRNQWKETAKSPNADGTQPGT